MSKRNFFMFECDGDGEVKECMINCDQIAAVEIEKIKGVVEDFYVLRIRLSSGYSFKKRYNGTKAKELAESERTRIMFNVNNG